MTYFEVHIPATDGNGFNVTLKVGADNWMAAIKAGMQKLGEQGTVGQNVMVDIQDDNSIHVSEAASGRVFRIRELTEDEASRAQVKRPSQIRTFAEVRAAAKTEIVPVPPAVTKPAGVSGPPPRPDLDKTLPPSSSPSGLLRVNTTGRIEVKDVEELVQPLKLNTTPIGRQRSSPSVEASARHNAEEILADVFLRVVDINSMKTIEEAMDFLLGLALEKVPCEAGSVLRADVAIGDLTFIVARGPKAKEILQAQIVIPAGTGIAGFCAAEGVSVAVNDAEKDPRFYAEVGARVGYATRSILCAPMMTHGNSFGCVQLINRQGSPVFLEHEVGVLAYLAHQGALFLHEKLMR